MKVLFALLDGAAIGGAYLAGAQVSGAVGLSSAIAVALYGVACFYDGLRRRA